jgi:membrane protein YqaA with SNARE-associated domain
VTGVLLATVLTGFVSAFLPVVPVEPYLVALVATTAYPAVPLGLAAAAGQTAGKLLIFLAVRGAVRSSRLRAWLDRKTATDPGRPVGRVRAASRRLTALLDRPAYAAPVVLCSASVGFPPLLLVSAYAGRTRMTAALFAAVCLVGRAARFVALAAAPHLVPGG